MLSKMPRTSTASRSTTSSCRSAPAPCAAGCWSTRNSATEPLIAQIPVSVRSPEQQGTFGNRILLMGVELHTEIARSGRTSARNARIACGDEGTRPGAAGIAAPGRQQLHPAGAVLASRAADLCVDEQSAPAADVEPRGLQRAGAADSAVLRGCTARGDLPGLGDHGRPRSEHHGHELQRQHRHRHRRRPRRHARRRLDDRLARGRARGARHPGVSRATGRSAGPAARRRRHAPPPRVRPA